MTTSQTVTLLLVMSVPLCYDTTEFKDIMTININNLSKSEILELERQIQEYKKTEKFLTGYKVTFCVKFNPETRKESDICDTESFGQWLCDFIPGEIIGSFNFMGPEDVSSFDVVEMTDADKLEWRGFWDT